LSESSETAKRSSQFTQQLAFRPSSWRAPQFDLVLVLAHQTGTGSAMRQLRWSDIDLDGGTVHGSAELDKVGMEHTTLLTDEAGAALWAEQRPRPGIGNALAPPAGPPANPEKHLL